MAAKYRKIDPRFWRDEKVQKLKPQEKLIAVYCFTGPETNRIGIYSLSVALGADLTGFSKPDFVKYFVSTHNALNWKWDMSSRVIYLPTWWKYNPPENVNHLKGCLKDLHDVPSCPQVPLFLANTNYLPSPFNELLTDFAKGYAIPYPIAMPNQEQELNQEQKQDKTSSGEPAETADSAGPEWPVESAFVKSFLETQTLVNLSPDHQKALLNPEFWERTSIACGGIDLALLQTEFAKIGNWIADNPSRKPTPKGIRKFVSGWLERAYQNERRYGVPKQATYR